MASNFIEFNVGLPVVDKNKPPEQQIEGLRSYIKGLVDQLRYEFRHINIQALEAGKIQGILGLNQGGTGAVTEDAARANLGIPEYVVDSVAQDNISISAGSYTSNVDIDATKSGLIGEKPSGISSTRTGRREATSITPQKEAIAAAVTEPLRRTVFRK